MSAKSAGRGLCCVAGRYRRTIGRFTNANGKTAPKKFLLGTDRRAAQLANIRLEQLWVDVTRATAEEDAERRLVHDRCARLIEGEGGTLLASAAPRPREPLWDGEALSIAERIRTGAPNVLLPAPTDPDATERCYVHQVDRLRRRYPSVSFVPGDVQTFQRGQQAFKGDVAHHAARAADAAAIAELPLPAGGGQTLYAALDDYVRWVRETKVKSGKLTPWGKVLAEQVNRLKNAHPDVTLSAVDYNALEKIKTYWAGRPLSARCAKPLALDTVRTQLGAARMFVKWLHKNPEWKWRRPDDWEDALKCELAGLMSDDEIANLKRGPASYSVEELAVLYRYATDREGSSLRCGCNGCPRSQDSR
jgi:hypothetical protein